MCCNQGGEKFLSISFPTCRSATDVTKSSIHCFSYAHKDMSAIKLMGKMWCYFDSLKAIHTWTEIVLTELKVLKLDLINCLSEIFNKKVHIMHCIITQELNFWYMGQDCQIKTPGEYLILRPPLELLKSGL